MIKSSNRPLQYQDDLPVFKSHENMGNKKHHAISNSYSLVAQQNFYQRYNSIREQGTIKEKIALHMKSNSVQVRQAQGLKGSSIV